MEDIVDLLSQHFTEVKFTFSFDKQLQKFIIECKDIDIYFSEEMKNVLSIIRDNFEDVKFIMVFKNG